MWICKLPEGVLTLLFLLSVFDRSTAASAPTCISEKYLDLSKLCAAVTDAAAAATASQCVVEELGGCPASAYEIGDFVNYYFMDQLNTDNPDNPDCPAPEYSPARDVYDVEDTYLEKSSTNFGECIGAIFPYTEGHPYSGSNIQKRMKMMGFEMISQRQGLVNCLAPVGIVGRVA